MNREQVIGYLKGFYDGEGNASSHGPNRRSHTVSVESTSPELMELAQSLLISLGFTPRVSWREVGGGRWSPAGRIVLSDRRNLIRFARLIGFRKKENAERLRLIRQSYWRSRRRNRFTGLRDRIFEMYRNGIGPSEIARKLGAANGSTIATIVLRHGGRNLTTLHRGRAEESGTTAPTA